MTTQTQENKNKNNNDNKKNDDDTNNKKPKDKNKQNTNETVTKTQLESRNQTASTITNSSDSGTRLAKEHSATQSSTTSNSVSTSKSNNKSDKQTPISTDVVPTQSTPTPGTRTAGNIAVSEVNLINLFESIAADVSQRATRADLPTSNIPDVPLPRPNIGLLITRIDIAQMETEDAARLEELTMQLRSSETRAERAEANARTARADTEALRVLVDGLRETQPALSATQPATSIVDILRPVRTSFSEQLREINRTTANVPMELDDDEEEDDPLHRIIMDMMNMNHNLRNNDDAHANDDNGVDPFPFFVQHHWPMAQWPNDEHDVRYF